MSDVTTTVDTYLAMWNETDPTRRAEHIERAWTGDGRYVDPSWRPKATPPSVTGWPACRLGSPTIASAESAASTPITTSSASPGSSRLPTARSWWPESTWAGSLPMAGCGASRASSASFWRRPQHDRDRTPRHDHRPSLRCRHPGGSRRRQRLRGDDHRSLERARGAAQRRVPPRRLYAGVAKGDAVPRTVVVSAFFLRPAIPGPAKVRTGVARSGRRVATGEARLIQEDREVVRAVAISVSREPRRQASALADAPTRPCNDPIRTDHPARCRSSARG
jgi:hypothetical protein